MPPCQTAGVILIKAPLVDYVDQSCAHYSTDNRPDGDGVYDVGIDSTHRCPTADQKNSRGNRYETEKSVPTENKRPESYEVGAYVDVDH